MQDSLSFALTQISYLVFNINKRNFSQNLRLINKLVQQFGLEADRHYLRCLFSSIDFGDVQAAKNSPQAKLLSNELTALLDKPSLISNICFAFDNQISYQKATNFKPNIHQISKTLNFSSIQEVALTLALVHSSNIELEKSAENHLKICLPNLLTSYINLDTTTSSQDLNLNDISPELLQLILSVLSHEKYRQFNITEIVYNKFIDQLCKDFPKDRVPLILAPLLYTENFGIDPEAIISAETDINSEIMDTSWSNLIVEIGYAFTAGIEDCKNHLSKVGGRDLTPLDVARLISLMCRTHTNLSDSSINLPTPNAFWNPSDREKALAASGEHITWKPEVFVQALKEVAPNLDFKNICIDLDHPDFLIKDRTALNLLLTIFHLGLQLQTNGQAGSTFPAECLYRHWNNFEGQLSLIGIILKNPDLYSFADHIFTSVSIELLKTPPEMDNKEIAAWKSLHLVDVLLYIGDNGLFAPVLEMFKVPLQHCPDVLFMALLQINPPITPIRQELFNKLLPIFLANHPNSGPILHHAWNAPNFNHTLKHFIMQAMSDWYVHGDYDQSRLTRILDVAQDLKALSSLLNVRSFMFVIDLACLASRREYLKLEKWLSDKIREHGEPFVQAIAKFLQRRCPQIMGMKIPEDQIPKSAQLPQETLVIMLTCLQAYAGNVQQELADVIMTMTTNCNLLLNKNRQVPPPGVIRQRETPFSASGINPHVFGASAVDSIAAGLNTSMAGLNLAGPAANAFNNYGNVLGNLVSTPASPSRLLGGPSNSPFPLMSMQGVGGNANSLSRLAPTPINDKLSMPSTPAVLPEIATQVSKEVEDEANSYFQRIYNVPPHPTLSIDEVLDMLQRFQESQNRREREVYQCMLRNLFEEYKFFPQYPDKELQITAQLFGGMIERHLVTTYVALGLALRCVLDALKKPEGSKMYYFGITALDKFKTKLHLYQKYCEHVRSLPNFNDFPPDLIQYVEYGCQGQ
jgi:CCR4-NOT transcription complex subunit 1